MPPPRPLGIICGMIWSFSALGALDVAQPPGDRAPSRFDHARITAALEGKLDTTRLTDDEEAAWLDPFTEKMGQPSDAEVSFFARRRALGRGVGLDAGGNLIHARDNTDA